MVSKIVPANAKTSLCKFYTQQGYCHYGNSCSFAHGKEELLEDKGPCWYYNTGGCFKSPQDCIYNHIKVSNMRKPIHLQHPCKNYHYHTIGDCKNKNHCLGDHSYELTKKEWEHHYPTWSYPGEGYLVSKQETNQTTETTGKLIGLIEKIMELEGVVEKLVKIKQK